MAGWPGKRYTLSSTFQGTQFTYSPVMTNPFPSFVPLLNGFSFFDLASVMTVLLAILAFSLTRSTTYSVNDLPDLNHDHGHARKRNWPFASCVMVSPLV
jgi:4-hydroxybenzoate polyprenyltransferase